MRKKQTPNAHHSGIASSSSADVIDVKTVGFPLAPDDFLLQHVGRTSEGNGFWIAPQLAIEGGDTRDFIAAYLFDKKGNLISCEVVDMGVRKDCAGPSTEAIIQGLRRKIDAGENEEIWVKPFSTTFYGYTFGLVVREMDKLSVGADETIIDAMPGSTLMFYGPWSHCNYG